VSEQSADGADDKSPIDKTIKINEELRAGSSLASMSFSGVCGYHSYFIPDEDGGVRYATETALHAAFDEAFQELWVGPTAVEGNHGEFTPEAAAEELAMQLEHFYRINPEREHWANTLIEKFEKNLREYERQLSDMGDDGGESA